MNRITYLELRTNPVESTSTIVKWRSEEEDIIAFGLE